MINSTWPVGEMDIIPVFETDVVGSIPTRATIKEPSRPSVYSVNGL